MDDFEANKHLFNTYFNVHQMHINQYLTSPYIDRQYIFGNFFYYNGCLSETITLDIQSRELRNQLIESPKFISSLTSDPYFRTPYKNDLISDINYSMNSIGSYLNSMWTSRFGLTSYIKTKLKLLREVFSEAIYSYPILFTPYLLENNEAKVAYDALSALYASNQTLVKELLIKYFIDYSYIHYVEKNSVLSKIVATELMRQRPSEIQLAISICSDTENLYPEKAISFYVSKNFFNKAAEIIETLSKSEPDLALELLIQNFKTADQVCCLRSDTPIALTFSKHWMDDSRSGKFSLKRFKRMMQGFSKEEHYVNAGLLDSNIALNFSSEFLHYYIGQQQWEKAENLFFKVKKEERSEKFKEKPKDLVLLSNYLSKDAEEDYNKAKKLRDSGCLLDAEPLYLLSLQKKVKACCVVENNETKEDVAVHFRLYAQILFDKATDANENITSVKYTALLNYLKEAKKYWVNNKTDEYWLPLFFKISYQKALLLFKNLLRTDSQNISVNVNAHLNNTREHALNITTLLKEIFEACATVDCQLVNKSDLAHCHFLMAEIIDEYEMMHEGAPLYYYEKATKLVHKHPYYLLRLSEFLDGSCPGYEKAQYEGALAMRAMGLGGAFDYMHWYDERWLQESYKVYKLPNPESLKCEKDKTVSSRFRQQFS